MKTVVRSLLGMLLMAGSIQCLAQTRVVLKMGSRPSQQKWIYDAVQYSDANAKAASELQAFIPKADRLSMDTVDMALFQWGGYSYGGDNAYHLNDVVEGSHGFSITVTAQVLDYTHAPDPSYGSGRGEPTICSGSGAARVCDDTNLAGFCFQGYTGDGGSEVYGVCLTDVRILLWPDQGELYDTKAKHVYRLEVLPGVGAKLYVDNKLELSTGVVKRAPADHNANGLWFGDMTGGANAKVDIFDFVYSSNSCAHDLR